MKTQRILFSLITLVVLVFSACREVTVTTKINPDGSFTRIITVTGDSSDVFKGDLPFPVDGTWETKSTRDSSDSTKYILTYTKSFRNSDELNSEINSDTSSYRNLEREVSVVRKFGFFYSWLTFREVYKSVNPFTSRDYNDYLTEEDIQWSSGLKIPVTSADSARKDKADDKVGEFIVASAVSEIESIMQDGIIRLDNPLLNPMDISLYHDSLYKYITVWDLPDNYDFIKFYSDVSGNEYFSLLNNLQPPIFEGFSDKISLLDNLISLEGYTEEVEMPGLITATNSSMLKGNQVSWEFQPFSVMVRDYEMSAESRVINYWAFILTGIVLLAMMVVLVIKAVR